MKYFIDLGFYVGWATTKILEEDMEYICYAFDPNKTLFDNSRYAIKEQISDVLDKFGNRIIFSDKAAWIDDCELDFVIGARDAQGSTLLVNDKKGNISTNIIKCQCFDFSKWVINTFNKSDYINLKIDIEGAEYKILPKMIAEGSIDYINKIEIEFHIRKMKSEIQKKLVPLHKELLDYFLHKSTIEVVLHNTRLCGIV